MEFQDLRAELDGWLRAEALTVETNLLRRVAALDFVGFVREVVRRQRPLTPAYQGLLAEAEALATTLHGINADLFARLREGVRSGLLRGQALRAYVDQFTDHGQPTNNHIYTGYNGLDSLVDGLFALATAPAPTLTPTVEMVHCEETPACAILDLIDQCALGPQDVFYDLGSGLGQVVMLVHLLTGVKAKGVEFEPAFCTFAQQQATALNLPAIEFINADARNVDYHDGTLFFLFTPFRGQILRDVLARLEAVAHHHPICLCTFGSCSPRVAQQGWLRSLSADPHHEYKLIVFESRGD